MKKDLHNKINEAFENIKLPDKSKLWERIDAELDKSDEKRVLVWFRFKYFFGFLLLFIIGIGYGLYQFSTRTNNIQTSDDIKSTEKLIEGQKKNNDLVSSSSKQEKYKSSTGIFEKSIKKEGVEKIEPVDKSLFKTNTNPKLKNKNPLIPPQILMENVKLSDSNYEEILAETDQQAEAGSTAEDIKVQEIEETPSTTKIEEKKSDSIAPLKPLIDTASLDTLRTPKKILFGFNFGVAVNNYIFTTPNTNPINLLTFGLQATCHLRDDIYIKSLLNFSNEAMDIEYYDYQNDVYKAENIRGCRNLRFATLGGKQIGKWGFDAGSYISYALSFYGTTTYFRDISSNIESERIEGQYLISSHKLDKNFMSESYLRKLDFGLQLGINHQFNKINLGFSYAQGLRDFIQYDNYYKGQNIFNPRRNLFITLGYKFN